MKYINTFKNNSSYEEKLNGRVDISLPNVSYCKDVKDVHYTPYNLVRFYVGEITGASSTIVDIYTDLTTYERLQFQVSEGNKWYSYAIPKDKVLHHIVCYLVKKIVVRADINYNETYDSPDMNVGFYISATEASFKGSNTSNMTSTNNMFSFQFSLTSLDLSGWDTSNVTDMRFMFFNCLSLTSLDLSGWDTSNVTDMHNMFRGCSSLKTIRMVGCKQPTIDKIKAQLTTDGIINNVTIVTE